MPNSYYPLTNEGRALWWENIQSPDAQAVLLALGLSAPVRAAIQADAAVAIYIYRTAPQAYESYATSMNGWGHVYLDSADGMPTPAVPALPVMPAPPTPVSGGIEVRRAAWVQTVKNASGYDPLVQGATLRTEMTGDSFNRETYQAVISGATSASSATVTVKFRKASGHIDSMAFQGRKAGGGAWVELGRFMATPASLHLTLATPGQPEEWEIRGHAYIKDTPVGVPSQAVSVLVRG